MTRNKGLAMQPRVRVFVSYAREDAAFVDRLTHALGTRGIECWVDRREIAPAADWLHRILDSIVKPPFFVFLGFPPSF